jgi:hypothetical protein
MSLGKINRRLHRDQLTLSRHVDHYQSTAPGSNWNSGISYSCHYSRVSLNSNLLIECNMIYSSRYLTQYHKLGVELASVSGQEFYPVYILAPQSLFSLFRNLIRLFM